MQHVTTTSALPPTRARAAAHKTQNKRHNGNSIRNLKYCARTHFAMLHFSSGTPDSKFNGVPSNGVPRTGACARFQWGTNLSSLMRSEACKKQLAREKMAAELQTIERKVGGVHYARKPCCLHGGN